MNTSMTKLFMLPILLAALVFMPAGRAAAQTFTRLHTFDITIDDNGSPGESVIVSGNIVYGTTPNGGGLGYGNVFAVKTDGTGYTNVYVFTGGSDGDGPVCNLILSGNTLYGTTGSGGSGFSYSGFGTVFAVNTNGSFTNLYKFTGGNDGATPAAGLILSGNTLYGMTTLGGTNGAGGVFALNTNGSFTNLYSFSGFGFGYSPFQLAGLVLSGNTLYGVAGGFVGDGNIFAINTDGTRFTNLYSFSPGVPNGVGIFTNSDGILQIQAGGLIVSGNTLYGTAMLGGTNGYGTVFAINTNGTGFRNLHNFTAPQLNSLNASTNSDGINPVCTLMVSGNTLYGTAESGGTSGLGTIFSVNTDGSNFKVLYAFHGTLGENNYGGVTNSDGYSPIAGLFLSGNTLYGTTEAGGIANGASGTVFSLTLPPPPSMGITTAGNKIVLSWPTNATGFTLQSITNLSFGSWSNVTTGISTVGTNYMFTNTVNGNASFFRLMQ
jgi:uncharacterized repeat protein (TIGR03803 family)